MSQVRSPLGPRGGRGRPTPLRTALAWGVHFYTALGLFAAAGIAVLIVATDGTLARAVRIKEVLPGCDGRRLDDLIDFINYTCLPLLLLWQAELLPPEQEVWLLLPLLASAYGFCQVAA